MPQRAMNEAVIAPTRHKLDVEAFYRMAEAGILGEDERVELIDGDLIDMAPIGQGHEAIVGGLNRALVFACGDRAIVWPQNSIRLNRWSAPQPDFAVIKPRADFYATGDRPNPADVLLMVEVSESSLNFDQTVKRPLYAQAGIGELWIVNLKLRLLEAYRTPTGPTYAQTSTHHAGERLALALAPDIVVKLDLFFA